MSEVTSELLWQSGTGLSLKAFKGYAAKRYFEQIASLRMEAFKEFPYLYDGAIKDEREYLDIYFNSRNCHILLVFDHDKLVGFSNSIPLKEESDWLVKPFERFGLNPDDFLCLSDFVIKVPYRGKGLLRQIFEYHERTAQLMGISNLVLMTVKREGSHPLRPENYRRLEPIWAHFGFEILQGLDIIFLWNQIDTKKEEANRLAIWGKNLMGNS